MLAPKAYILQITHIISQQWLYISLNSVYLSDIVMYEIKRWNQLGWT